MMRQRWDFGLGGFSIVQPGCKYLRGGGRLGGGLSALIRGCARLSESRKEEECIIHDGVLMSDRTDAQQSTPGIFHG